MTNHQKFLAILIFLLFPSVAFANAGIPMIFLAAPVFAISILPIILIESYYLSKSLALKLSEALKIASLSNLYSTIIGIPLTWIILVFVQMITGGGKAYGLDSVVGKIISVTWQAPWLIPYESDLNWMIPIAGVVLLIPFFFVSWWAEYSVTKTFTKSHPNKKVLLKVRNANLITYGLLVLWPVGLFLVESVI